MCIEIHHDILFKCIDSFFSNSYTNSLTSYLIPSIFIYSNVNYLLLLY